jgi:hypothetical protein
METKSLKMTIKRILIVAIVGIALAALAGCGHSHGSYRNSHSRGSYQHDHNDNNYRNNADNYRSGHGPRRGGY